MLVIGLLAIVNAYIIDGTGAEPISNGVVMIRDNRIVEVGSMENIQIPQSAKQIDAAGATILPGIINAHVHHSASPEIRRQFLSEGVTTVSELGCPIAELADFQINRYKGNLISKAIYAGPFITPPNGYPDGTGKSRHFNYEVISVEASQQAVSDLVDLGARQIKIALDPTWNKQNPLPVLAPEIARAVVNKAHHSGIPVRSHMIQLVHYNRALDAGVDVIEHMPFPPHWPTEVYDSTLMTTDPELNDFFVNYFPAYDSILPALARKNIMMCPTISALLGGFFDKSERSTHEEFALQAAYQMINRFMKAGGQIVVGNDYNGISCKEMLPFREMLMLKEAGLHPLEIIKAATLNAARASWVDEEIGSIEKGKIADLIIIDGNPLHDLDALKRIKMVILEGEIVQL